MGKSLRDTVRLFIPSEVQEVLDGVHPMVEVYLKELTTGNKNLSAFNQRKQRATRANEWGKFVNLSLAVELYKTVKFMNEKEAY